ncbi:MAG: chromate transporter [Myxococcaceae bacterium]|nr:chromate transporter [Myxococcaceae bacterium]
MSDPLSSDFGDAATQARIFEPYTVFPDAEAWLEEQLGEGAKLQLSARWREGFVRWLPWIAVVLLPLHLAAVLVLLGISAVATFLGSTSIFVALASLAVAVLEIVALPGLFARTRRGWAFYTYARVLGTGLRLLHFSVFGLLLGVVSLWIAFQVKREYR